jgi:membrane protein implicated in regulation of membrane protease activity
MDNLQILYLIFFGVGFFFLAISVFGGDIEVDVDIELEVGDMESASESTSIFSIRTLATFLVGFGVTAWTVARGEGSIGWQIAAGIGSGVIISALYYFAMRLFFSMQGSSMVTASSLIGKEGIITIPTTSTGVAQVRVATVAGNSEYTCKETEGLKLKQNDLVKVTSVAMGVGTITVEKLK